MTPSQLHELQQLREYSREFRFKIKAFGILLNVCLTNVPKALRQRINGALVGLMLHTRGEHPLVFEFDGHKVEEP